VSCLRSSAFSCCSTSNSASFAARRRTSTAGTDSSFRVTSYTSETNIRSGFQEAIVARQTYSEQQRRVFERHTFDAVFAAEDMRVLLSAPRAPRMNAHSERVIGTIRREVLDHVLIMNEAHAGQVLAEYRDHYNRHRPHRSRDQRPPETEEQPAALQQFEPRRVLRRRVLGGVVNEYRYAA
jgi:transposase InsO family protein